MAPTPSPTEATPNNKTTATAPLPPIKAATGAERLGASQNFAMPPLPERTLFALHAPNPPSFWKVRTPLDHARWCWAWADAMMQTQGEATTPGSPTTPGVRRP